MFSQESLKNISTSFKQGNAKTMSAYFDAFIDLTFSDETNTYSKKQAELILQKFFSKVEPTNFESKRSGNSKYNNTKFSIGSLSTSNGEYKVYMFFIQKNNIYYLKEIRFEK